MPVVTWLITGTSSGLGLALAQRVLRDGHALVSVSRGATPHHSLFQLAQTESQLRHVSHDLTEGNSAILQGKIHGLLESNPDLHIDCLVNNAGIVAFAPVEMMSPDLLHRIMTVNFYSPFWLTQAILPNMRQSESDCRVIVNISSTQGLTTDAAESAYDASKHALEAFSGVLAKEVHSFGIRTLVVNLGSFRTSFASSGKAYSHEPACPTDSENDPYSQPDHPVAKRITAVMKYGDVADAACGDVYKAADVLFDAVMQTQGSAADGTLRQQRQAMSDDKFGGRSALERLVLGSDAQAKLEAQERWSEFQLDGCKDVSRTTDACHSE